MPAFEWVHVQLHQQKGMISLSPPTICNSAKRGVRNFRFVSLQRLTIRKTHRASNETAIYSYQDYQYHIFEKAVSVMKEKTHRGSSGSSFSSSVKSSISRSKFTLYD